VIDDVPSFLSAVQNGTASDTPSDPVTTGSLHFQTGADTPATVFSLTQSTDVTSGGYHLSYNLAGNVLTAYQDLTSNGYSADDTTKVFTLTIDPTGGTHGGLYTFDLLTPLDGNIVNTPVGGANSFGAAPNTDGYILISTGSTNIAALSGWTNSGTT